MKSEIKTLEVEQVALLTQYEQTFDLSAVKEAAMAAGMHQPSESQIIYISLPGEDQVTAYQAKPSLFEGFSLLRLHGHDAPGDGVQPDVAQQQHHHQKRRAHEPQEGHGGHLLGRADRRLGLGPAAGVALRGGLRTALVELVEVHPPAAVQVVQLPGQTALHGGAVSAVCVPLIGRHGMVLLPLGLMPEEGGVTTPCAPPRAAWRCVRGGSLPAPRARSATPPRSPGPSSAAGRTGPSGPPGSWRRSSAPMAARSRSMPMSRPVVRRRRMAWECPARPRVPST